MSYLLKDELLGLKEKLESIELEFKERIRQVEEDSQKFTDSDNKLIEQVKKNDFFLTLNIGGKKFRIKLSSIIKIKDTLFYNILSTYVSNNEPIPNEIFFDRPYDYFEIILSYLRTGIINTKTLTKLQKLEFNLEYEYYGLNSVKGKRKDIELLWDQNSSKSGACTVDQNDSTTIRIHSNTCYTHFVTDKLFTDDDPDFYVELDSTVTQTDNYYYIGMSNESYSLTGSCGCCNPANSFYVQCNGSIHINSITSNDSRFSWGPKPIIIGMKVYLKDKKIIFTLPEEDYESQPYTLTGNKFRIMAGHCNTGNGQIKISKCYELY